MNDSSIRQLQKITLLAVFLVAVGLFFWMFRPYLFSLFWACVLSGLFYPFNKRILAKTKKRKLSAFVTLLIALLLVILPLVVVSGMVVNEAVALYNTLNNQATIIEIKNLI